MHRVRAAAVLSLALLLPGAGCGRDAGEYYGTSDRGAKDPRTFYVNNGSEPEYLDPGRSTDGGSSVLILQLFEGLTVPHPKDGHPVQGAALRWEQSADNRLYRFHLRPEGKWSDGKAVTANDFEWSWRRVLRPKTAAKSSANLYSLKNAEAFNQGKLKALGQAAALLDAPREGAAEVVKLDAGAAVRVLDRKDGWAEVERFDGRPTYRDEPKVEASPKPTGFVPEKLLVEDDSVLGVRAVGDLVLEVELEQPTPYFVQLTSHSTLMPVRRDLVEAFEARGEGELWQRPEHMISNGPYTLEGWRFQYEITMKANPFYWDRAAMKIDRIVWLEVENYHATMNLYKAGELDYLGDNLAPPPEYQPFLATKKDYQRNDYLSVYWYELNVKKPPLDDVRVRKALNLAIDKKTLVDKITRAGQRPATHIIPDFTGLGYSEEAAADRAAGTDPFAGPEMEFNPERARALLAEAGFKPVKEGDSWRAEGFPALEVLYNTSDAHRQIAVAIQAMWKENLGVAASLRNEEWKVMLKNHRDGNFQIIRLGQTADYDHAHTFLEQFGSRSPQNLSGWGDPRFDEALKLAAATADPKESIHRYRAAEKIAVEGMSRIPLYFYTRSSVVKPWVKGFWGSTHNGHAIKWLWIDPQDFRTSPNEPAMPPREFPKPGPWGLSG